MVDIYGNHENKLNDHPAQELYMFGACKYFKKIAREWNMYSLYKHMEDNKSPYYEGSYCSLGRTETCFKPLSGEFVGFFEYDSPHEKEREELILEAYKNKVSMHHICDNYYPYESLKFMYDNVIMNKADFLGPVEVTDEDIYKLLHSTISIDLDKLQACLTAVSYGVYVLDKIDRIAQYDMDVLDAIVLGARKGVDVCDIIEPGISVDNIKTYIYSHIK